MKWQPIFYLPRYLILFLALCAASACYGFEDDGVMIAAASDTFWNDGGACGQMYQVTCLSGTNEGTPEPCLGSGSVVVKIVDHCPPGSCRGTIDLSQEAFESIADTDAGVINISYQQCVLLSLYILNLFGLWRLSLYIFYLLLIHFLLVYAGSEGIREKRRQ